MELQIKSSEISLKDLFKDLLIELKGFKYQITLKVLLSKVKSSFEVEYSPVYFISSTKIVINSNKFKLDDCFKKTVIKKVYQRCVNKPNFASQKILDKNFVAVHYKKTVLTLNRPIYVGFSILELSQLLMYQFHYEYVMKTFKDVKLLSTDTDSLVYEIKDSNVYDQCFKDKYLFDFSGYPKDSVYYCDLNKKVLGKMKDEFNGVEIDELVGLKIKMHSLFAKNGLEVHKVKGVNLKLRHILYVNVLSNKKVVRHKMNRILSEKHKIGSYIGTK